MTRWQRYATPSLALVLLLAACSSGGNTSSTPPAGGGGSGSAAPGGEDLSGQTVTVIGAYGGDEEAAFHEMVKPWEAATGATMKYTGTRDLNAVLTTGTASGVLPDIAGLPGPGQLQEFATGGSLKPLDDVLD
ncbi:MAG TPA: carbohydrate ABC transporter substrate-binding protein, partial [Candidatus Limnocylindria bacterium]|nr:carbohydrate ABC transporter substrate-binding protein [Candidatus Limnocylindria bacterium]